MKPRNLQLLVIDDNQSPLLFQNIDLAKCALPNGSESSHLSNWSQHISMWSNNEIPKFDLAAVDINFREDPFAPQVSSYDNCFGLLHALPLLARQSSSDLPLEWVIFSGSVAAASKSPLAIVAFGLLTAMSDPETSKKIGSVPPAEFFSRIIQRRVVSSPTNVLADLMFNYRKKLVNSVGEKVYVNFDEIDSLVSKLNSDGRAQIFESGYVTLFTRDGVDAIWLKSLFAELDADEHDSSNSEDVNQFLTALREAAFDELQLYDLALRTLENLDKDLDRKNSLNHYLSHETNHRATAAALVLVCFWLRRIVRGLPTSVGDLLFDMGFDQTTQFSRVLKAASIEKSPSQFLTQLTEFALPLKLRRCAARYYLEQLKTEKIWNRDWPVCLGEEPKVLSNE